MPKAVPAQQARVLWQIAFAQEVSVPPLALADGIVIALTRAREHTLRRLDAHGEAVWSAPLERAPVAAPVRSGRLLAIALEGGQIAAMDLTTGAPLGRGWAPLGGPILAPIAALGGRIYARVGEGAKASLVALEPAATSPLWRSADPSGGGPQALMRLTDGILIYAGTAPDGSATLVRGLDPTTGAQRWAHAEIDCELNDLWAVGGVVDLITTNRVVGLDPRTGQVRNARFTSFPLEDARAPGDQLVAMMDGHTGPVLLCFDLVSQRLHGRISRAMTRLVGAHPNEAMVTLVNGDAALYALPGLSLVDLPESQALGTPLYAAWSRDLCYVVPDHRRALTAIDLEVTADSAAGSP